MTKAKCGCLYEGSVIFCTLHTAAPDLLEAAKEALRRFEELKMTVRIGDGKPTYTVGLLRAAIAKAEGDK